MADMNEELLQPDNEFDADGFPVAQHRKKRQPLQDSALKDNSTGSSLLDNQLNDNYKNDNINNNTMQESFQQLLDNIEVGPREKVFIDEYVATLNKAQSFRVAFPEIPDNQIRTKVNALLEKQSVKNIVAQKMQKNLDADVSRSPSILLKYVERFVDLDVSKYYYSDGTAKPLEEIEPEDRLLIENISTTVNNKTGTERVAYVLPSKLKALDKLESIVKLMLAARSVVEDAYDSRAEEDARKRDEIFNMDSKPEEVESVIVPKRGRGRPKKESA